MARRTKLPATGGSRVSPWFNVERIEARPNRERKTAPAGRLYVKTGRGSHPRPACGSFTTCVGVFEFLAG
jgi:hypothetical protein